MNRKSIYIFCKQPFLEPTVNYFYKPEAGISPSPSADDERPEKWQEQLSLPHNFSRYKNPMPSHIPGDCLPTCASQAGAPPNCQYSSTFCDKQDNAGPLFLAKKYESVSIHSLSTVFKPRLACLFFRRCDISALTLSRHGTSFRCCRLAMAPRSTNNRSLASCSV